MSDLSQTFTHLMLDRSVVEPKSCPALSATPRTTAFLAYGKKPDFGSLGSDPTALSWNSV